TPRAEVAALTEGDRLYVYATRGAWRNPTRDRGRVIGTAWVTSKVRAFDAPLESAGRRFSPGCALWAASVVRYRGGVELGPRVGALARPPRPAAWTICLRRSLLRLPPGDARLLDRHLGPLSTSREAALPTYEAVVTRR